MRILLLMLVWLPLLATSGLTVSNSQTVLNLVDPDRTNVRYVEGDSDLNGKFGMCFSSDFFVFSIFLGHLCEFCHFSGCLEHIRHIFKLSTCSYEFRHVLCMV